MIILSNLQIRRGINLLLDGANATVNPGQKVGLVGKNGCGKSTLFCLLKQEITADQGKITIPINWTIAWVNQETPALTQHAIDYVIDGDQEFRQLEQQLATAIQDDNGYLIAQINSQLDNIDAWTIRSRASSLLYGLGFTNIQLNQPICVFSGGWRMRLNLAQALICRSDLLLLDEPTNHLDLDTIIWLEKWLQTYTGTLILISHDRDFLDPIIEKIIHIEQHKLFEYTGNYSSFERQRVTMLLQQQASYQQQQRKVNHLQSYINRFRAKASKAKQAQSRIKMLEKMEALSPIRLDNPFQFQFLAPRSLANPIITLDGVSAGYDNHIILDTIKLNLVPGSRIGLLGRNGAGKSTLVKLLANIIQPSKGKINLSVHTNIGYFAQHQLELLNAEQSPLQHLRLLAPDQAEQKLRTYLGGFNFQNEKVHEPVINFSGGEKARLVLALIVWQRPNLLLLDEPTNHLDLEMRQALIEALTGFEGALIIISHDRYFLRSTVDEFYLVDQQKVTPFAGDLLDYQQWLSLQQKENTCSQTTPKKTPHSKNKKNGEKPPFLQRSKIGPLLKKINECEKKLDSLHQYKTCCEQQLTAADLYTSDNKQKLAELLEKQQKNQLEMEEIELYWLELQQQLQDLTE